MLKLKFMFPALLIVMAGCSQKVRNTKSGNPSKSGSDSLYVDLQINSVIKNSEKVNLKFTVHNDNPRGKSFCKWHTPYEPLMSKYFDITDENGNEVPYKGPMAKRIMPPPADSYLVVNPQDTITTNVDLSKAYQLDTGKSYTVSYNSSTISGLRSTNKVKFMLQK